MLDGAVTAADPFAANVVAHEVQHRAACFAAKHQMVLLLRTSSATPLVLMSEAATALQAFMRRAAAHRTPFDLWRVFEFLARRVVRCRRRLRTFLLAALHRRRREIDVCVARWTAVEREAHAAVSFVHLMTFWVADAAKRAVVVEYRRLCMHRLAHDFRAFRAHVSRQAANFFSSALATHAVTPNAYHIVKLFLFNALYPSDLFPRSNFFRANIYTLVVVAARLHHVGGADATMPDAVVMERWVRSRTQRVDDVPADPFIECAALDSVVRRPLFSDRHFVRREKRSALFRTPFILSDHVETVLRQRADDALVAATPVLPAEADCSEGCDVSENEVKTVRSAPLKSRRAGRDATLEVGDGTWPKAWRKPLPQPGKESNMQPDPALLLQPTAPATSAIALRSQARPQAPRSGAQPVVGDFWLEDAAWEGVIEALPRGVTGTEVASLRSRAVRRIVAAADTRHRELRRRADAVQSAAAAAAARMRQFDVPRRPPGPRRSHRPKLRRPPREFRSHAVQEAAACSPVAPASPPPAEGQRGAASARGDGSHHVTPAPTTPELWAALSAVDAEEERARTAVRHAEEVVTLVAPATLHQRVQCAAGATRHAFFRGSRTNRYPSLRRLGLVAGNGALVMPRPPSAALAGDCSPVLRPGRHAELRVAHTSAPGGTTVEGKAS